MDVVLLFHSSKADYSVVAYTFYRALSQYDNITNSFCPEVIYYSALTMCHADSRLRSHDTTKFLAFCPST